ncbi:MAG TPA: c-type cytochrome [Acidobacteriaceae bacterium]|nr:c-type cytochrome [Acidobacteriaceae bacterium]
MPFSRRISGSRTIAFWIFLLLLLSIALPPRLGAQDSDDDEDEPPPPATHAAIAGKRIFQQRCGFCHGADGSGGEGPDLLHSSLVLHDDNGNLILPVVRGGRAAQGMPAFSLPPLQIRQIAAFLHEEIQADATIFYTNSTADYSLKKLLVGNASAGKIYFNGEGKCSGCHSPTGDLAHIASKYRPIELQSRIAYPAGTTPTIEVTLPSGLKLSGAQVYADPFVVSLRDARGWTRSFSTDHVKVEIHDPLLEHKRLLTIYTDTILHDLFAYLETLKE